MNKTKKNLCRLCLNYESESFDVFGTSTLISELRLMIHQLFSFWIKPADKSTIICLKCIELVRDYHRFHTSVLKNQIKFIATELDEDCSDDYFNDFQEKEFKIEDCAQDVSNTDNFDNKEITEESIMKDDRQSFNFIMHPSNNETDLNVIKTENDVTSDVLSIKSNPNLYQNNFIDSEHFTEHTEFNNSNCAESIIIDTNEAIANDLHPNIIDNSKEKVKWKKKSLKQRFKLKSTKPKESTFDEKEATDSKFKDILNDKMTFINNSDFPSDLIKNGKFIIKRSVLESIASKFFNIQCGICKEARDFHKLSEMMKHFTSEHGSRGFVMCCNTRLYRRDIIYMHMARHLQPSAFECPICQKKVTRLSALKPHLETHLPEAERSYKCDQCGKSYTNNSGLNYHKSTHIPIEQRTSIDCELCGKIFYSSSSYSTHISVIHSSPKYLCDECGRSFQIKRNYLEHLEVHDPCGKNKVQCQYCGFICKNKVTFKFHMKLHNMERFNCSLCDYSTHRKTFLNQHMMVKHSDCKPHSCDICGKQFKLKSVLNNHMAQHTGERKFACAYCPKTFASSGNYYTHRRRMHINEHKTNFNQKQKDQFVAINININHNAELESEKLTTQEIAREEIKQLNAKKAKKQSISNL